MPEFSKLTVEGNKLWGKYLSKIANWFVSGEVAYFEKYQEVVNWIEKNRFRKVSENKRRLT